MVEKGRKRQKVCVNDTDEKDENDEIGEKYVEIDEKIVESYDDNGGVENDNNEKMMNDELVRMIVLNDESDEKGKNENVENENDEMKTPDLEKIAAENKEEKNPQNTQKSPKIGFGDLGKNCGFLTSKPDEKPTPPSPG